MRQGPTFDGCLPWQPAPSSVTLDVPSDAPQVDVWVQEFAESGAAATAVHRDARRRR